MNRIQEALMHLHRIVMFVPDEVQDKLCKVEQLLKEELLDQATRATDNPPPCPNQRYNYIEQKYYCLKNWDRRCHVDCIVHRQKFRELLLISKAKESEDDK